MGYLKRTIKGVTWMGALRFVIRGLTFVRLAILARLLTPYQFGLFGIATLALAFLEIVTETGINIFFIQGEGDLEEYVDTAWIVSIARGIVIAGVIILSAPLISTFFRSQGSLPLLYLISIIPFLRGFINPSIVKFQKDLEFKKEFILRSVLFLVDSLVAVSIALAFKTTLSLVLGMFAGVVLEVFISIFFIKPKPKFKFDRTKLQKIVKRGKWVTLTSIMQYLYTNLDYIVVGRLLNESLLGVYQNAYKISTLPITEISDVFYKVSFPVFSKISDDKKRLWKAFLNSSLIVFVLVTFVGLIFYFFARQITLIILGPKWIDAVPSLRILAIYGIIRGITGQVPAFFYSLKKQEYVSIITFIALLAVAVVIFPLVKSLGIVGAAYADLTGSIAALPVIFFYLFKVLLK